MEEVGKFIIGTIEEDEEMRKKTGEKFKKKIEERDREVERRKEWRKEYGERIGEERKKNIVPDLNR